MRWDGTDGGRESKHEEGCGHDDFARVCTAMVDGGEDYTCDAAQGKEYALMKE